MKYTYRYYVGIKQRVYWQEVYIYSRESIHENYKKELICKLPIYINYHTFV